eukprot:m.253923 g.253923  ORF g.253923 m.253923 type:complete len:198 (+) comp40376_c1_seq12:212-805(+)
MDASFQQVSRRYGFPYDRSNKTSIVDWLLGAAVRLEYADNAEQLTKASETMASAKAVDSSQEPCSARDVDEASDDFKAGVALLAKIFQLPSHADHLRVLDAVAVLVEQRLSSEARVRAKEAKERRKEGDKLEFVPLSKADLGFDLSDPVLRDTAKVLRILHIAELRELQTRINEMIVAVQALTANPKTDQSLGKVGR